VQNNWGGALMVHMWRPGISHVRAPERGVVRYGKGEWGARREVWNEGRGCETGRSDHATTHDIQLVDECVVGMECARLDDLDCAIGWGGMQMVRMWQPGTRHVQAPKRGASGLERGNGCKTGRSVHAPKHDGTMVAERVFGMECV